MNVATFFCMFTAYYTELTRLTEAFWETLLCRYFENDKRDHNRPELNNRKKKDNNNIVGIFGEDNNRNLVNK